MRCDYSDLLHTAFRLVVESFHCCVACRCRQVRHVTFYLSGTLCCEHGFFHFAFKYFSMALVLSVFPFFVTSELSFFIFSGWEDAVLASDLLRSLE